MTQQALQFAEFAGPLLAGLLSGVLYRRYVFPQVLARVERLSRLVLTRGNIMASIMLNLLWLGLALVCHSTNAPQVLAWLQAHPVVSAEHAPSLLRIVSMTAAFVGGYGLTSIPSPAEAEQLLSRLGSPRTAGDPSPTSRHR